MSGFVRGCPVMASLPQSTPVFRANRSSCKAAKYLAVRPPSLLGQCNPPSEHREDQLPVAVGAALVVDISVWQCIPVLGALVEFVAVRDRRVREDLAEFGDKGRRRMRVVLGEATIELAAKASR